MAAPVAACELPVSSTSQAANGGCSLAEGSRKHIPVFVAHKGQEPLHPKEFAPMEHQVCDDELVYPVTMQTLPTLCFARDLGGRRSLVFEGLIARCFTEMLLDSGASHSFVSLSHLRNNNVWKRKRWKRTWQGWSEASPKGAP